jgi:acetyl esterase
VRYAEALRAAGVDVTLERYDDMVHSFLRWGGVVERARDLVEALGEYTRAALR